jgi:hypothetical protein
MNQSIKKWFFAGSQLEYLTEIDEKVNLFPEANSSTWQKSSAISSLWASEMPNIYPPKTH